jgi:hypothetical protein
MKRCAFALALALLLGACGGTQSVIDGTWKAVLSGAQQIYTPTEIKFTFTSTSNNRLSVTNLPASALGYCFFGAFGSSATFNDHTGGFQLTLYTTQRGGTQLELNGMLKNNTITGSWTMTSTYIACNEPGGTFTMTKR